MAQKVLSPFPTVSPPADHLKIWIASASDTLPFIDTDISILRYSSLAQALVADGHHVVIWTSTFAHWRKESRFTQDTTRQVSPRFTAEFLHAPGYSRNVSLARIRHNLQLARAFTRRAEQVAERPDVILAAIPCLELAEAAAGFALRHGVPFVCDIQDIWPDVYLTVLPSTLRPIGRLLLASEYARLRRILAIAGSITAVSQQYLTWAQQKSTREASVWDRVFRLGYRLPTPKIREQASARAPEFLHRHHLTATQTIVTFLGQFSSSYDLETVVAAASRLVAQGSGLQLVLAGAGDKTAKIQRAAAGQTNITLTGWLDYVDTIALLSHSHIGLAAYARRAAQSLPNKPFEYMAFGLPLISSLDGELREIIAQNRIGSFYRAGSAESLADAIATLAGDPNERAAAGARARSLFEREFDAEKIYSEMTDLLVTVVHNRLKPCP